MTKSTPPRKDFDVLEYWHILMKRKWVVVTVTAVLLALAAVRSFTTTPLYRASASILIEEPGSGMMTLQDLLNSGSNYSGDWQGTYFKTQLKILQSRTLAERVAKRMNLASRSEFLSMAAPRRGLIDMLKSVFSLRWLFPKKPAVPAASDNPALPPIDASAGYAGLVQGGMSVQPVPETRLVNLIYISAFPRLTADIVNALAEEYINFSVESRFEATQQTSEFLNSQIAQLNDEVAAKQRELQRYGDQKKIVPLTDRDSNLVSQYENMNKALSDATIARVNAETKYREMRSLRVDSLPQVINNPTIQGLRTTFVQLGSEYQEKLNTYKPDYPDMVTLRSRLESTRAQIENEITKAVDAAGAEYRTALNNENQLRGLLDEKRVEVARSNNDGIYYQSLRSDVESKQTLLNTLMARQNETGVSARLSGLKTSNIKIVDRALVPDEPFLPDTRRNLMMALLLGLLCGVGLAFVADFLDNSIKGPDDLEKLAGLPSLGVIPHFAPEGAGKSGSGHSPYGATYGGPAGPGETGPSRTTEVELINHLFPKIAIAEDYRTVRTAILFSQADTTARTIAFTSASPQEGKSTTLANLAVSFAQLGDKVLAIDADLRKPRLHKIFQVRNLVGLSGVLTGRSTMAEAIQPTLVENLSVLPAGPHPPNPAELLNSRRMKELMAGLKEPYTAVLIDTPPVLAVIDPVIVGSMADCTILVLRTGKTTRKQLQRTIEELSKGKARIIGGIFNDAKVRRSSQSANYFQYEYYQDRTVEETSRTAAASKAGGKDRT